MSGTAPPPVPPSPVAGGRAPISGAGKIGLVFLTLMLLVVLYWLGSGSGVSQRDEAGVGGSPGAAGTVRRIEPLPPPPPLEPLPVALPAPTPRPVELAPRPARPRTPVRPNPIMGYEEPAGAASGAASPSVAQPQEGDADDALAARLRATRTDTVQARRLRNPDLTITMGTIIPCTPQQPLNTQLEGFLSCVVPVDVRGTTGRVTVLNRGTRIVGQVRSGMRHGQNRAFVLWTRAQRPDGVVVDLASPGTDVIGQNGLDVDVNTNFWTRFGGALMLSFVDAGLQAAAIGASSLANDGSNNSIRFFQMQSGGRNAAATALDSSINIPPYGTRPQGVASAIFVARDLDFSAVDDLMATR